MDDKLRKIERALAQDPTNVELKAALVSERVRAGLVPRAAVIQAATLDDEAARLLEPKAFQTSRGKTLHGITQTEMLRCFRALGPEKALSFTLDCVERSVLRVCAGRTTHTEAAAYLHGVFGALRKYRYAYQGGEVLADDWFLAPLAAALDNVVQGIAVISVDQDRAYRYFDSAISDSLGIYNDNATAAAEKWHRDILVGYLVGDSEA